MSPNHLTRTIQIGVLDMPEEVTFRQVLNDLNSVLHRLYGNEEEKFGPAPNIHMSGRWYDIRKRRLMVFPIEGSSEGHYIHVETSDGPDCDDPDFHRKPYFGKTHYLMTLKTFNGADRAQDIVSLTQWLLTNGTLR